MAKVSYLLKSAYQNPMSNHEKINYIEFPATDLKATKTFFERVFNWAFTDYGLEYTAFNDGFIDGGFFKADLKASAQQGSALIVLYSEDLEATQEKVEDAGGEISVAIFSFPGGRRFHFIEPSGNELAVWSDLGL